MVYKSILIIRILQNKLKAIIYKRNNEDGVPSLFGLT